MNTIRLKLLLGILFVVNVNMLDAQTDFGTWINVWNTSSRDVYTDESFNGVKVPRMDRSDGWGAPDWNNPSFRQWAYSHMSMAGINFLVTDNTNGLLVKTEMIFPEIAPTGMKLCIAFSHQMLQNSSLLSRALELAGQPQYYKINNMPVLVCYVGSNQWDDIYKNTTDTLLTQFYRVWASGEDSRANKWGWQLEPQDGPVDSDYMFVTPAVKHIGSQNVPESVWSYSVAMLDYSFSKSITNQPKVIIAGSFDDIFERNGWLPVDTEGAVSGGNGKFTPVTGIQIFSSLTGDIAEPYYFYNRVTQWIRKGNPDVVPGGSIADGIYQIKNMGSGDYMQTNPDYNISNVKGGPKSTKTYDKFVLYHIGNNEYRMANVYTGWPIMNDNGVLVTKVWTPGSNSVLLVEETSSMDDTSWQFEMIKQFGEGAKGGLLKIGMKDSGKLLKMSGVNIVTSSEDIVISSEDIENTIGREIIIYPNPAKDFLHVIFPEEMNNSSVSLYNMNGKLIFQHKITTESLKINIENELSQGLYVLTVLNNSNFYTKKVMIE